LSKRSVVVLMCHRHERLDPIYKFACETGNNTGMISDMQQDVAVQYYVFFFLYLGGLKVCKSVRISRLMFLLPSQHFLICTIHMRKSKQKHSDNWGSSAAA
jgi:hypothetical protein